MKILVTGGAGFIGSWLCERLIDEGNDVVCLDNLFTSSKSNIAHLLGNSKFEFWRHDVCDPWHIECDQVYHLACPASPVQYQRNPVRTIKTAILGTLNSLEMCRNTGARLLITSTSEVYGDPEVHPQVESYYGNVNPVGDRSCYDEGKRAGESLAASWSRQYGTDVRIARIFNTYGPRMDRNDGRLIPNFVRQMEANDKLTIYGNGKQTRSWCYVSDTVSGLIKLMNCDRAPLGEHPVVNIGNPDERTILDIAKMCLGPKYQDSMITFHPLPTDDPKQRKPDITKATEILGWKPTVSLDDGLESTLRYFFPKVHSV
jgi:UDP-glucuronate decarboxylase